MIAQVAAINGVMSSAQCGGMDLDALAASLKRTPISLLRSCATGLPSKSTEKVSLRNSLRSCATGFPSKSTEKISLRNSLLDRATGASLNRASSLIEFSKPNSGCNGGLMDYASTLHNAKTIASGPSGGATGYKDVSGAPDLVGALNQQPVSVAIEADQAVFQKYKSGTVFAL